MYLRQSTSQVIRFGPFLDSTDGVTAETALTIAQADMQLSKDGGAFAQKNTTGNATHDADGWYSTTLDTTDTNTVGELYLQVAVTGALPVWVRWWVLEEAIYDALFGASAAGFNASGLVTLAATTHTGAVIPTVTTLTGHTAQTGDNYARLGAPAGASVSADIAAIEAQTDDIGAAGAGLTAVPWNAAWDAEVQSEVTDALNAYDPPTNAEMEARTLPAANYFDPAADTVANVTTVGTTTTNTDMRGTDNAATAAALTAHDGKLDTVDANVDAILVDTGTDIPARFDGVEGATFNTSTDSLEAIRDRGDAAWLTGAGGSAPTVAEIADGVWDEAKSGHVIAGSFGEEVQAHSLSSEISALNDVAATDIVSGGAINTTGGAVDNVTLVATTTTNTDMRGTDNAATAASLATHDGKLDTVDANVDAILLDTGTDGVVVADKTGYALSTAGIDAILDEVVEGSLTMRQMLRLMHAALAGKSSGGGTTTITFRDNADAKARITATVDANGNRTAVTLDGS